MKESARLGRRGEAVAAEYLTAEGFEVLDRNWKAGRRELDIVAREGEVVAFVEVKSRSPGPQAPLDAITRLKRHDLRIAAERWIHAHPGQGREFRFDAISVIFRPGAHPELDHVRQAFFADDG